MNGQGREHRSEAAGDREGASQRGTSEERTDRGTGLDLRVSSGAVRGSEQGDLRVLRFASGAPWEAVVGYSRVVVRGDTAWVSGTTSVVDGAVAHPGDAAAQTRQILGSIEASLERAGFTLADVVRTRMYVTDISRWAEVGRAHGEVFGHIRPATTMVEVASLIDPAMLVEIEADAVRGASA